MKISTTTPSQLLTLLLATAPFAMPLPAAPITLGNLVVVRVGDGLALPTSAAAAVFVEEYTTAGALVQSLPLPVSGAGMLTMGGTATTEGILCRTQNGGKILFGGYRKAPGGTNPSADTATATLRTMAQLLPDGTITSSMDLTDVGGSIRSVVSVDGTGPFYVGSSTGVRYSASPGATTATTNILDARNSRQVYLTGNVLYASNGSTTIASKVQSYGTLPTTTTAATAVVGLATADAVNGFWMADLSTAVAGDDTIYVTSTVENLVRKYSFDGAAWVSNGSLPGLGVQNVTGILNAGVPTLYLASTPAGTGKIYAFTDTTGYNGTLTGGLGTAIISTAANTAFRGISLFLPATATYQFINLTQMLNGVESTWSGTPGRPPVIMTSLQLTSWSSLGTATETALNSGIYKLLDTSAVDIRRKFYRIGP